MPKEPVSAKLLPTAIVRLRFMRAHVYFRRQGETAFRDLGNRDIGSVPAENDKVIINVDRETIQAKVCRVRTFLPQKHEPEHDPDVYLESV